MEGKKEYLQMIQEPICRMSTISAIFKGFVATIVSGVSLISYESTNAIVLLLSFLPIATFAVLDVYYLMLERKFRFLYDQVREGIHPVDFSMTLTNNKTELKTARARIRDCIISPSIYWFYPIMFCILTIVFVLKVRGII